MKIKKAGIFDFPKINKIIVDDRSLFDNPIFTKGVPPDYSTWLGLKPIIKYLTAIVHPRKDLLFAMEGEEVVGVAVVNNINLIDGFFINKEYRGKGFGKLLMDYVCSFLKNKSDTAEVGVQTINKGAIKFYENCGFKIKEHILSKKLR